MLKFASLKELGYRLIIDTRSVGMINLKGKVVLEGVMNVFMKFKPVC